MADIDFRVEQSKRAAFQAATQRIRDHAHALEFIRQGETKMELKNKSDHEIQTSLSNLRQKAEDIVSKFSRSGWTDDSRKLFTDIHARIGELEAEQSLRQPQAALTVPGGSRILNKGGSADGPFRSFGEQLQAVMRSSMPGQRPDDRLYQIQNATGLSETTPSDGGFLVQSDFSTKLLEMAGTQSLLYPRVNKIQISGNSNSIELPGVDETSRATGSRWGGVQTYWLDEAQEKSASKPKFRQVKMSLKKLAGLCYATDELIQDSSILGQVISQSFSDEISFVRDDMVLNGTGAGQPLGILNSAALVTQDAEGGQAADSIVFENCLHMFSRMVPGSRKNAVWIVSQSAEVQLYQMSLAVGTGGSPIFLPGGSASPTPYATLFGRPVLVCEQAAALGDLGDILFIDPSQYLWAEKGGIKTDMSIHVKFEYDESVFRFVYRCDGCPSWANSLTPFKGSDSVSPFVALAAR